MRMGCENATRSEPSEAGGVRMDGMGGAARTRMCLGTRRVYDRDNRDNRVYGVRSRSRGEAMDE